MITFFEDAPYSPAFWGTALLLGLALNRVKADRSACWVGPISAALLTAVILASVSSGKRPGYKITEGQSTSYFKLKTIAGDLFGLDPNLCGGDECLGRLFFTTPVLSTLAYSIGAWFGLQSKRASEKTQF